MKRDIIRLNDFYTRKGNDMSATYRRNSAIEQVRAKIALRGIEVRNHQMNTPNIFWVGTDYDQDYSGFIQSLSKYGLINTFINSGGKYGLKISKDRMDIDVIEENSKLIIEQIKNLGNIDMLFGQMMAMYVSADALKHIQKMGIITINISMDDRLPALWKSKRGMMKGGGGLVDGLDLVLTTSKEACQRYMILGCPSIYWPLASDPNIFHPLGIRNIDVCFVGSRYGIRDKVIRALINSGIRVEAFGPGWQNGKISASDISTLFGKSKIVLGIGTVGHSTDVYTLKLRDFDATMSGALYVTHRNPDLIELFKEDEEIVCYKSIDEVVTKVHYYLNNDFRREQIAQAGMKKAITYHTWDKRFAELFGILAQTKTKDGGV